MATESVVWPCETAAAAKALLRVPKAGAAQPKLGEHPHPKELRYAETTLEPLALALKTNLWPRLSQRGAFIILVRTPGVTPRWPWFIGRLCRGTLNKFVGDLVSASGGGPPTHGLA